MLTLGIDPGLAFTGYACVEAKPRERIEFSIIEAGVFRLDRRESVSARLAELEADLAALIDRHHPACICVESLFAHYSHPRTAITMAHARGVILLTAEKSALPLIEIPPASVKKAVTGNGRATKAQVQFAVAALLGLAAAPEPADVADAIAVALCGARRFALSGQETPVGLPASDSYTGARIG